MAKRKVTSVQVDSLPAQDIKKDSPVTGCLKRLRNYTIAIVVFLGVSYALSKPSAPTTRPSPPADNSAPTAALSTPLPAVTVTSELSVQPVILATSTSLPTDAPTMTASATITDTPAATVTPVPVQPVVIAPTATTAPASAQSVTSISATTYYAGANGANLRSCAARTCETVASIAAGGSVVVNGTTQGEEVSGSTLWYRLAYGNREAFVHSSVVGAAAPVQVVQPVVPVSSGSSTSSTGAETTGSSLPACPSNCDEARAAGWTNSSGLAQMCPKLDRDKDGKACES